MKKAEIDSRLLDLKAQQDAGEKMPCPRCGRNTIKAPLAHNALSRYADLYICDECGMTEAMLDMMRNPLPLEQWAVFKNTGPEHDFKALSMQEVVGRASAARRKRSFRCTGLGCSGRKGSRLTPSGYRHSRSARAWWICGRTPSARCTKPGTVRCWCASGGMGTRAR